MAQKQKGVADAMIEAWTATPDIRSTNARMNYVWLDLPELPHAR